MTMPDTLTLDEFIVATLVSMGPGDPGETIRQFRELRMHLGQAAELHDPDLTLDDQIPTSLALTITHDATDLDGLRHDH